MGDLLIGVKEQLDELRRYRELYGPLPVISSAIDPAIAKNLPHVADAVEFGNEDVAMIDMW